MNTEFIVFDKVHAVSGGFKLPDFRYEEIKNKIASLVEKYKVHSIPVNVFALARKLGIRLVKFTDLTNQEVLRLSKFGINKNVAGFYALAEKNGEIIPYIYYNDKLKLGRIRFTILHEIGHIILGHKGQSDLAEAEADFFAKYFIAPPMLIDKIRPQDYMDIKKVFLLTNTCAWNSFDYYQNWKRHHLRVGHYEAYENRILSYCSLVFPENYAYMKLNKKVR